MRMEVHQIGGVRRGIRGRIYIPMGRDGFCMDGVGIVYSYELNHVF